MLIILNHYIINPNSLFLILIYKKKEIIMKRIHTYDSFLENILLASELSKQNAEFNAKQKEERSAKQKSQQKTTQITSLQPNKFASQIQGQIEDPQGQSEMEMPQGQIEMEAPQGQAEMEVQGGDIEDECDDCE